NHSVPTRKPAWRRTRSTCRRSIRRGLYCRFTRRPASRELMRPGAKNELPYRSWRQPMAESDTRGPLNDSRADKDKPSHPAHRRRLWIWFVAGFLLVFLGMSFTVTMYAMAPSGDAVMACKLWQYYIIVFQRELNSSGAIGPASGYSS